MHQQWDLRFSEIKYLTKDNPTVVKKFLYSNKIGFGIKIHGIGKSVATRTKDNRELTSVLKFSSIKQGLGYWKYVPEKLLESGYIFRYPTLEPALKNILNNEQYIKSIFVSALLSTLFFLVALFYSHFKYDQIPTFKLDDFIVLTIGIA